MKNLTALLLLAALTMCSTTKDSPTTMSPELRRELQDYANERMEYMLKNRSAKEPHMTMSIVLTDCRMAPAKPIISSVRNQIILEEEACSTTRMAHWCKENPERPAMMTTWNEKTNRTALVKFQCRQVSPVDEHRNSMKSRTRTMMHCLVAIALFAIIRSWYLSCTRPVPVHPSKILNLTPNPDAKSSQCSDSFESITFDTTKTRSKSRLALSLNRTSFNTSVNKFRIIV